jgi:microsomal dipeptidase-like Zn-dependent dipeptidase
MANIGYYESSLATYNNVKKGFIDENKHQIGSLTKEEFDASFFKVNDGENTLLYLGDKLISNSEFEGFEGRIVALENQINDIVKHMLHIKSLGCIDNLALGSDFDGIETPVGMSDCTKTHDLKKAMIENGFTQEEIDKVFYKNFLRVFKQVCKN